MVREWTDPRDGTTWEIELGPPESSANWVWKEHKDTALVGAILRFSSRASPNTRRETYYAASGSTDLSKIPDERLMALLDRAEP